MLLLLLVDRMRLLMTDMPTLHSTTIKVTTIEDLINSVRDAMIIFGMIEDLTSSMRDVMISFSTGEMIITTGAMTGIISTTTVTMTIGIVTMRKRLDPVQGLTRRLTRTRPPGGTSCLAMCTHWAY